MVSSDGRSEVQQAGQWMGISDEVVVIGGANIDIKARAGGELIAGTSNPGTVSFALGGVARNIAHSLAQLDIPVALISAVGTDAFGDDLLARTEAAGVDVSMVLRQGVGTGSYVAILDPRGEMTVAVNAMPAIDGLTPDVLAARAERLQSAKLILVDCNVPQASLTWLTRFAGKLIVEPVSVAKSQKLNVLGGCRIFGLALNRLQAECLCGRKIDDAESAFASMADLHRQGFERVVMTLGRDGAVASHAGTAPVHVEALGEAALDVTGAGDAAAAGLVFGLMQGFDLALSTRLGQAAASLALAGMGAVSPELSRPRLLSLAASRMDER